MSMNCTSFSSLMLPPPSPTLFPYTTLFRSVGDVRQTAPGGAVGPPATVAVLVFPIGRLVLVLGLDQVGGVERSEEHTSELQSHSDLVCRLLLEKKNRH